MGLGLGHRTAAGLLHQHVSAGALVADVGAFPGTLTTELAKHWRVIALDADPERPIDAQSAFHSAGVAQGMLFSQYMKSLGMRALKVDIERDRWPIEDGAVDAVVFTEVIEHLYSGPLHALLEANRILKPGGILLLSTPNLLSIRNRANFFLGHMDRVIQDPYSAFLQKLRLGHHGHVRLYAASELSAMLNEVGFAVSLNFYPFGFWDGMSTDTSAAPTKRKALPRFIKSPANYWRAMQATSAAVIERLVPSCRKHMFAVCRKTRTVSAEHLPTLPIGIAA